MGVPSKYAKYKTIPEEGFREIQEEILNPDRQLDEMNAILTIALRKCRVLVASTPDFQRGEIMAIERLSQAFTKVREDQRKDEEFRQKNESDMTREQMIELLAQQIQLLSESEKEKILLKAAGGEDEDSEF